jgi:hypothetical protein
MRGSGSKPVMNGHRRKVLNLLEFCLEMNPDIDTVFNLFVLYAAQQDEDHVWVSEEQWGDWLQDYADKLLSEAKDV